MNLKIEKKTFINIEFPVIVKNIEKAFKCLDGINGISKSYKRNERMECRLRPYDDYCKPMCSNRSNVVQLVMKVKRRKRGDIYEYKGVIVGVVDVAYVFQGMCDFQYLPMYRNVSTASQEKAGVPSSYTSLVDELIPKTRLSVDWLDEPCRPFLSPIIFSRVDHPTSYSFRDKLKTKIALDPEIKEAARLNRSLNKKCINFGDPIPPAINHEQIFKSSDAIYHTSLLTLIKLFEKRPIYRRTEVRQLTKLNPHQIRLGLNQVGYYYNNGPWRTCWLRSGYDPSKDPSSKIYQIFDFRLRYDRIREMNYKLLKNPGDRYSLPHIQQRRNMREGTRTDISGEKPVDKEISFKFNKDIIPNANQMFYHLCNIEIDEVQRSVHQNDGQEGKCDDKLGFITEEVHETIKNLIFKVREEIYGKDPPSEYDRSEGSDDEEEEE